MIKGCGAERSRDHIWCAKCGACWDVGDQDPAACYAEAVEYVAFYLPLTALAVAACWLVSPVLAVMAGWLLLLVGLHDVQARGRV